MSERELLVAPEIVPDTGRTKYKILLESVRLFARSGYSAVSVRDIAAACKIQPATIYAHFASKQDILESIMQLCEKTLVDFYGMLDRLAEEADSFAAILNNIFAECKNTVNPFAYYSVYCAMTTQFENESCRRLYYDFYFKEGHIVMRRQLETAIRRGLVPPFDVPKVASLITNCILMMVGFHVGYLNGFYQELDIPEWYDRTIHHILQITGAEPGKA